MAKLGGPRNFPLLPVLAVIGAMSSLAVGTAIAKSIFPTLGAAGVTFLRATTAAVILAIVWRPWRRRVARADWPTLIGYGASIGVMNLLFYEAVARVPFGIAVAFEFCGPLAVAIFGSRRLLDFTWVILAAVGLALLLLPIGHDDDGRRLDPAGVAFALGAGTCWAIYILIGARAGRRLHGGHATAIGMVVAAIVVTPFGIARGGTALLAAWPIVVGIGVGLMSGAVPFSLEMYALARLPRHTFSVLVSMEPALAALMGWIILREHLSALQTLAICSVVIASIGSAANARRDPPPPLVD